MRDVCASERGHHLSEKQNKKAKQQQKKPIREIINNFRSGQIKNLVHYINKTTKY